MFFVRKYLSTFYLFKKIIINFALLIYFFIYWSWIIEVEWISRRPISLSIWAVKEARLFHSWTAEPAWKSLQVAAVSHKRRQK